MLLIPGVKQVILVYKSVVAGFLDLAKAFDCVNHSIVLDKLAHYGVMGDAHGWFESYLCGRQQLVRFNGSLSKWGSAGWDWCATGLNIRALIVFYIFVNDLPTVVDHAQIKYADDTELHCCGEDLQCVQNDLQSDFYQAQDWCRLIDFN